MKKAVTTEKQKANIEEVDRKQVLELRKLGKPAAMNSALEWLGQGRVAAATTRESDKFILRLPEGVRQQLAAVADRQGRSMNAVVVTALTAYLVAQKTPVQDQLQELVQEMRELRELIESEKRSRK
jgi:predicted HicB family RNase H-like nuclease